MSFSIKKAGIGFKVKVDLKNDKTGLADGFTLSYFNDKDGSKTDITDSWTESDDVAGLYFSPEIAVDEVGDYTFVISNDDAGLKKVALPVVVTKASIDDIKEVVDTIEEQVVSIKEQVDTLDEEALNQVKDIVDNIKNDVSSIHDLVEDRTDIYIELNGDETAKIKEDDTITGSDSGATGKVYRVSYDEDNDITKITLHDVTDEFKTGEKVKNSSDEETDGTIQKVVSNSVNSVLEFVSQINSAISDGGSALEVLKNFNKDIEHMIKGDDKLEDGSDNPLAGKSIPQIYDNLNTYKDEIESKIDDLSSKLDDYKKEIVDDLSAIKTVVDSNSDLLNDEDNGLEAIKKRIDEVMTEISSDEYGLKKLDELLEDENFGLSALKDLITSRFDKVDDKLQKIEDKIDENGDLQKYNAFA